MVQKIIHLQNLANRLPDAFIDSTKVTKSHIPAANISTRIEITMEKLKYSVANEHKQQLKHGWPIDSKYTIPKKRKSVEFNAPKEHTNVKGLNDELITPTEASIEQLSHEIVPIHNNEQISINYIHKGKIWDRNTTLIDRAVNRAGRAGPKLARFGPYRAGPDWAEPNLARFFSGLEFNGPARP